MESIKEHWEHVYATKRPDEMSWTQAVPQTSLDLIESFGLPVSAGVIDVGGGDGRLVDGLLDKGYTDITVLDISAQAIERARKRLGDRADRVTWMVSDIVEFKPVRTYDIWHDRATFHFLTHGEQVDAYLGTIRSCATSGVVIATFSTDGPERCSGLDVQRYSESTLEERLSTGFTKMGCLTQDHTTPFGTQQRFLFCAFRATP
ncbi:class I SAM-dependent methyltransferase [Parapedobacter sp.]